MKKKIIAAAAAGAAAIAVTGAAYAADIAAGESRADIHVSMGEPAKRSDNGMKELFTLPGGETMILIYNVYDCLNYGYIVH